MTINRSLSMITFPKDKNGHLIKDPAKARGMLVFYVALITVKDTEYY